MKKVLLTFAVVALGASFTSCKKEYTCECGEGDTKVVTTAEFKKKADAEAWCEGSSLGFCELK